MCKQRWLENHASQQRSQTISLNSLKNASGPVKQNLSGPQLSFFMYIVDLSHKALIVVSPLKFSLYALMHRVVSSMHQNGDFL